MAVWIKDKKGSGGGGDITALQTQVTGIDTRLTNLSNIALKNNLADQTASGLRVTKTPTDNQDVMRLGDVKYTRIVNHGGNINANTNFQWTLSGSDGYTNGKYYHHVIMFKTTSARRYCFTWSMKVENNVYSKSPIFNFTDTLDNLNVNTSIFFEQNGSVLYGRSNVQINNVEVWRGEMVR